MVDDSREFNAASFYQYLKEGKLMGIRCRACGALSAEARPLCPACHSKDVVWHQFSGKAQLSTFTCISVVPEAMAKKGYGRNNPYCSGIVTLEEGPRISAQVVGVDASNPQNIRTGLGLVLKLDELDPERPVLTFQPA
jgi:uncharacterized OB-fold protein